MALKLETKEEISHVNRDMFNTILRDIFHPRGEKRDCVQYL